MPDYNQRSKIKVRKASLSAAVSLLTEERNNATLARRSYLRDVWCELKRKSGYDRYYNSFLSGSTISRWERFYDSVVGIKKASELKVAYLCGPEPLNDLEILVRKGVLPENVWAFESDKSEYETAVANALNSRYPFLKILRTDMKTFVEASPVKFDLIYLDFCGPIYNRHKGQKNLETLTAVARHQSLNSPGVLLTNFALPSKDQDAYGHQLLSRMTADYLYPKAFTEDFSNKHGVTESPFVHGYNESSWRNKVDADLPDYYGQFVTRLIMDLFTYLVPMDRFMNNSKYLKTFFNVFDGSGKPRYTLRKKLESLFNFSENGGGGDIITDANSFSLSWTVAACLGIWEADSSDEYFKHAKQFVRQLTAYSANENELLKKLAAYQYLMTEGYDQKTFYSDSLLTISNNWNWQSKYQFCDLFLFHQMKDTLVRQISVPYQVNVEKTKRWTYKAKETQMFTDMLVFDECRYVYDWMPTMDMIEKNMENTEQELSFRYIMDAVGKHTRWYFEEVFSGMAVIDMTTAGFEARELTKRQQVK